MIEKNYIHISIFTFILLSFAIFVNVSDFVNMKFVWNS